MNDNPMRVKLALGKPAILGNTVWIAHQGRTYSGVFEVRGERVIVWHAQVIKEATLDASLLHTAAQLLFAIVVTDGAGIPDPLSDETG